MNLEELQSQRDRLAVTLLNLYKGANAGHIGSSLSCLEILIYLYQNKVRPGDAVILSKGHAAGALYVVLDSVGKLGAELDTFYKDGTLLAAHPPCNGKLPQIPFGTGSLGHGLSIACGLALSSKLKKDDRKVYCIVSDGDMNEGSSWEALHFAAHHKLTSLHLIVDRNGLQGLGRSDEILNLEPMAEKLELLGFSVSTAVDGNSFADLEKALNKKSNQASCLIAKTKKGHGVSYMENKMEWHYLPMNEPQYQVAISEQRGDSQVAKRKKA